MYSIFCICSICCFIQYLIYSLINIHVGTSTFILYRTMQPYHATVHISLGFFVTAFLTTNVHHNTIKKKQQQQRQQYHEQQQEQQQLTTRPCNLTLFLSSALLPFYYFSIFVPQILFPLLLLHSLLDCPGAKMALFRGATFPHLALFFVLLATLSLSLTSASRSRNRNKLEENFKKQPLNETGKARKGKCNVIIVAQFFILPNYILSLLVVHEVSFIQY